MSKIYNRLLDFSMKKCDEITLKDRKLTVENTSAEGEYVNVGIDDKNDVVIRLLSINRNFPSDV